MVGGSSLPETGRSSDETQNGSGVGFLSGFGSVSPVVDFQMLATLKHFWLFNPDVSQYVANIVNLGNPGHTLSVEAANDSAAEQAVNRLNESASRIYRHGCGVDGLLNQYFTSVAWSGAISSEDVVDIRGRRVDRVVLVPVEQIRFVYNKETDEYEPYQRSSNLVKTNVAGKLGMVPLNRETYKYLALSTVENSPYAKPPATAAVEAIMAGQKPLMENIQWMAQKFGLLGMVSLSVMPPKINPQESDQEYQSRVQRHITAVASAMDGNFSKGLVVHPRDQKIEHTAVAGNATGVYDINRISEEQVFSGLGAMPGFHGRTDSTTETFATVVFDLLMAQVGNIQRIVKRRQEQTCRLDLRLAGIDVDSVSLNFVKAYTRDPKADAETAEIRFRDALARVRAGLVEPDAAAQELGYDFWADPELLFAQSGIAPKAETQGRELARHRGKTIRLTFDKGSQRYRHQPDTVEIWSGVESTADSNVVPIDLKKKHLRIAGA